MAAARMSKKQRQRIKEQNDALPDIFGDLTEDLEVNEEDPLLDLTMHPVHFTIMFVHPGFTQIQEGTRLSYGEYIKNKVPRNGIVQLDGRIMLENIEGQPVVESLTHMGGAYSPASHGHAKKTSDERSRPSPNGWERVWVILDSMGRSRIIKDVFMDNWRSLGYTPEQIADVDFLYSEVRRMGHPDFVDTPFMQQQLKQWHGRTGSGKKEGASTEPKKAP